MSLQFVPYAMRVEIKNPLTKLIFIRLVSECMTDGYSECFPDDLAIFSGATREEVLFSLHSLFEAGLIYWPKGQFRHPDDWSTCICKIPITKAQAKKRKSFPPSIAERLSEEFGESCSACKSEDYEDGIADLYIDHIVPRSRGGTDDYENLQLLCRRCNSRKSNKVGWVNFYEGCQ